MVGETSWESVLIVWLSNSGILTDGGGSDYEEKQTDSKAIWEVKNLDMEINWTWYKGAVQNSMGKCPLLMEDDGGRGYGKKLGLCFANLHLGDVGKNTVLNVTI